MINGTDKSVEHCINVHLFFFISAICKRCRLVLGKTAPDELRDDTVAQDEKQDQAAASEFCFTEIVNVSHKCVFITTKSLSRKFETSLQFYKNIDIHINDFAIFFFYRNLPTLPSSQTPTNQ